MRATVLFLILLLASNVVAAAVEDDLTLLLVPSLISNLSAGSGTKPGPHNTGPTINDTQLQASAGMTVTNDGVVIQNLDIDGCIKVEANNVTIRNVKIDCGGFYGIQIVDGYTGALIESVEIFGMQSAGIYGSNFTVRNANIHDAGGDAIKAISDVLIESSWLHRLGYKVGSHSDGVQMVSGNNVKMIGNNFDMPHDLPGFTNSQCMIIQTNNGPIDDILIKANWLNGGGYCVQINDKGTGHGPPTNVRIIDNKFGRDCNFGILRFRNSSPNLSGNTWEDTGQPIANDYTACR